MTVTLTQPTNPDVKIDTDAGTLGDQTTLEFTTTNWNMEQTVTVTVSPDDDAVDDTATIGHSASGGDYGSVTGDVSVNVDDDEMADVGISSSSATVEEGTPITYRLTLTPAPTANVTVNVVETSDEISVSPTSVTFDQGTTEWSAGIEVEVTTVDDGDDLPEVATITHQVATTSAAEFLDAVTPTFTFNITDPDVRGITITDGVLAMNEGATDTYQMKLDTQPAGTVTITPRSTNSDLTFEPESLEFSSSDWQSNKTVTVMAEADDDAQDDNVTITHTVMGYVASAANVTGTVTDPQTKGVTVVISDTDNNNDKLDVTEQDATGNTYTVKLDTRPVDANGNGTSATVMVTVPSGLTASPSSITFSGAGDSTDWSEPETVTVTAAHDADAADTEFTLQHVVNGGDYDNFSESADNVTVLVVDDDTPDIQFSGTSGAAGARTLTVTEETGRSYGIRLAYQPTASVTVTFGGSGLTFSPESLDFTGEAGDWNNYKQVEVTADHDAAAVESSLTIEHTVTMASGSQEYNNIDVDDVAVTVSDNDQQAIVVSQTTLSNVNEGSTAQYTVKLATQPVHASETSVTVSLAVSTTGDCSSAVSLSATSLTFNGTNWNDEQTVTVTAASDTNEIDDSCTVTHTATGMDYTGEAAPVTSTINTVDAASHSIRVSSGLDISEGSTGTFDVRLNTLPSANVDVQMAVVGGSASDVTLRDGSNDVTQITLTFTTGNWDDGQTVTVAVAEDYDAANDEENLRYTVTSSASEYSGNNPANTPVNVTDNDSRAVNIPAGPLTVTEGDGVNATETYGVTLTAAPASGTVTIRMTVTGSDAVTVAPTSLTFTASDWETAMTQNVTKEVTVTVAPDDDAEDATATIEHGVTGADYQTESVTAANLAVEVDDSDEATIVISRDNIDITKNMDGSTSIDLREGVALSYNVRLAAKPTGDVTVVIKIPTETDTDINVVPSGVTLTFTADDWNSDQLVTVSAVDDDGANDTGTIVHEITGPDAFANLTHSAEKELRVTVIDDDGPAIDLRPTTLTFEEGQSGTYEVKLATRPSASVAVGITVSPTDITVSPTPITFTPENWNVWRTVTVTGEDTDTVNTQGTITHTASGGDYASIVREMPVTMRDDDVPRIEPATTRVAVNEGERAQYSVKLAVVPSATVTVTVSVVGNSDVKLVDSNNALVNSIQLEFTTQNWESGQTVTVAAEEDIDTRNDTATIRHAGANGGYGNTVTNVTVAVTDNDEASISMDPTSLTIVEGKSGTYTIVLGTQPTGQVNIGISVSGNQFVSVNPSRLAFNSTTWDDEQTVTVNAATDPDTTTSTATVKHVASGSDFGGETGDDIAITILEDGSSVRDTSSFLRSSPCDTLVVLTWNAPTGDNAAETDHFILQWKSGGAEYDEINLVQVGADKTTYTLQSLANDVSYTIRMMAVDSTGDALWTREVTTMTSDSSCITEISFGNILADSAPVIVNVGEAAEGTQVNMRYRSLNPGAWSPVQSKILGKDETSVTFDVRGLKPENSYEVQAWLGSQTPPEQPRGNQPEASIAQTLFTSGVAPDGATFTGGVGGSSGGRILRIEPSIKAITLSPQDEVLLSVEVWGRQDILANDLADKDPADNRPIFTWSTDGGGTFNEANIRSEWKNGAADDRTVVFTAPDQPGKSTVTISLGEDLNCLSGVEDESQADHLARCSARVEITVRRPLAVPISTTAPVNPPGIIPETLTDDEGTAYAVFTPVEGGSFLGDGYSLTAGPGAVGNGEFIGLSMAPIGDASNVGSTWHRYTLAGLKYAVLVVDSSGAAILDYALGDPISICAPLPDELRGSISDIVMTAANQDDVTVLSTSVKIGVDEPMVCGNLSSLPAIVAVGKEGSPPEIEAVSPQDSEERLPDTGGVPTASVLIALLLLFGALALLSGAEAVRRARR